MRTLAWPGMTKDHPEPIPAESQGSALTPGMLRDQNLTFWRANRPSSSCSPFGRLVFHHRVPPTVANLILGPHSSPREGELGRLVAALRRSAEPFAACACRKPLTLWCLAPALGLGRPNTAGDHPGLTPSFLVRAWI